MPNRGENKLPRDAYYSPPSCFVTSVSGSPVNWIPYLEVPVIESDSTQSVSQTANIDDSCSSICSCLQHLPQNQIRQQEVSDMVAAKLRLNAIFRRLKRGSCHNPSTIDQDINLLDTGIFVYLRGSYSDRCLVREINPDEPDGDRGIDSFDGVDHGKDTGL